jgi:hypothetical protein
VGIFSSIANFFGAQKAKKAAGQAAAAQQAAAQQGIDAVTAQQAATQASLAPWTEAGRKALSGQTDLLGLNGGGLQGDAIAALKDSPLFQSLFNTGQEAILQNGSATGGLRGGNIQSSLANFGSKTLADVIQQQLANLGGISSGGSNTALNLGQLGAASAANVANLRTGQGQAKAGGIIGQANAMMKQYSAVADFAGTIAAAIAGGAGAGPAGAAAGAGASDQLDGAGAPTSSPKGGLNWASFFKAG